MSNSSRQLSRANHFVAAGYLAPFTDSGTRTGVLQAYRRSAPRHPLAMTAESVAWENDLYTHRAQEGVLDDSLEQWLATEIEGPFLAIRNRLLTDPAQWLDGPMTSFSPQERHTVAMYLAIQHLRTPTERDGVNWLGDLAAVRIVRDVPGQADPHRQWLAVSASQHGPFR